MFSVNKQTQFNHPHLNNTYPLLASVDPSMIGESLSFTVLYMYEQFNKQACNNDNDII